MSDVVFRLETATDGKEIAELHAEGFPQSHAGRAAVKLRKGKNPLLSYCFVAQENSKIIGSVRFYPAKVPSGVTVPVLGPLVVAKTHQEKGLGRALVSYGLHSVAGNEDAIVLIGSEDFYAEFCFESDCMKKLRVKGEVEPLTLLGCEFVDDILADEKGYIY